MPQCKANSKRTGKRCRKDAIRGRETCKFHGGKTPVAGPTHPAYKTGRYSKALNGRPIQELYEVARNDPHLLALTEEIALLVAKQQETMAGLSTGESGTAWEVLAMLYSKAVEVEPKEGMPAEFAGLFAQMGNVINDGLRDDRIWDEYTQRAESIRRLVDTERKYREGLRLYLPLDKANAIMGVWLDCIRRVVPREYIAKLHEEFRRARPQDTDLMPSIGALPPGRNVGAS